MYVSIYLYVCIYISICIYIYIYVCACILQMPSLDWHQGKLSPRHHDDLDVRGGLAKHEFHIVSLGQSSSSMGQNERKIGVIYQ